MKVLAVLYAAYQDTSPKDINVQKVFSTKKILLPGLNVFMYYGPTVFKKIFHTQGSHFSTF